jgi:hypothetical protein
LQAVTLAQDDISDVTKHTKSETLMDEKAWSTKVAQPAISLATDTLAHLSSGYSVGTGWTAFMCAWISLANFVGLVHSIRMGQYDDIPRLLSGTVMAAMAPFVIASDLAHVSTRWCVTPNQPQPPLSHSLRRAETIQFAMLTLVGPIPSDSQRWVAPLDQQPPPRMVIDRGGAEGSQPDLPYGPADLSTMALSAPHCSLFALRKLPLPQHCSAH